MIISKQSLFILIIAFFAVFSFAQDDLEDLGYLESEDIACEDLPEAFNKYIDDVQLDQMSMQKTLASLVQFLRKTSEQGRLVEAELLKMIENLEQINDLSRDSSMILSDRAYNISDYLPDCIPAESSLEE